MDSNRPCSNGGIGKPHGIAGGVWTAGQIAREPQHVARYIVEQDALADGRDRYVIASPKSRAFSRAKRQLSSGRSRRKRSGRLKQRCSRGGNNVRVRDRHL